MAAAKEKRRQQAPEQQAPAGDGHSFQFISASLFAQLADISIRAARMTLSHAAEGKPWHGAKLDVRRVCGRGGERLEVEVSSLPVPLQAKWHRQQPKTAACEVVSEHVAKLETEVADENYPESWFDVRPITEEMHQALWAHYDQLRDPAKAKAQKNLEILTLHDSLAGVAASEQQRADIVLQKYGISRGTLYGLRRRVAGADEADWLPLLAPRYRNERDAAEYTEEAWEQGKAWYLTQQKRSARSVYRDLERAAPERAWIIPSYHSFRRMLLALPRWLRVLMRDGEKRFSQLYPAHARLYGSLNVHDVWVADGRMTDVQICDDDGQPYRGIIITMLDARTRMVVGYAIGKTESADLYRAALLDAIQKTGALPRELYLDNSRAAASKMLTGGTKTRFRFTIKPDDPLGICVVLGIRVIFALPGWAQSKPVESLHGHLHSDVDRKCGKAYVGHTPLARPADHDPRAAIAIAQYRKLFDEAIEAYHQRPHRGDAMQNRAPRAVYDELIQKTPVRKATAEQLALCMSSAERVRLSRKDCAASVWGNRYWAPQMADLPEGSFVTARFDPTDLRKPVRIYTDSGEFFCEAPLVARAGFRDQEAAKANLRAKRQWEKARKAQARAMVDMRKSASWLPASDTGAAPDPNAARAAVVKLPVSRVSEIFRPALALHRADKKPPAITKADHLALLARRYKTSGKS